MMTWCAAARSFHLPTIDVASLSSRAPLAAGIGCISLAGANFRRSALSPPFASLGISSAATAGVKEAVRTDKAPAALGPYSQAIKANNMLFVSGVLGLVPETGKFVSDSVEEQTEQWQTCIDCDMPTTRIHLSQDSRHLITYGALMRL